MARPRFHILKQLRLQLKSGYLKEEPFEYEIMRKFPPITKPSNSTYRMQTVNVPYAKLYRKIVNNHPLFQSEAVYGAYAGLEPQALTLAKKQYKYIQDGMNEKDAFNKAMEHVNELENNAYVSMKKAVESVRKAGGRPSAVQDVDVAKKLEEWQATMQSKSYDELTLEEQGELDYFVQTKVLGWNEVERERRMQDPNFFLRFQELLTALFPLTAAKQAKKFEKFRDDFKSAVLNLHGIDGAMLTTKSAFFVEDYLAHLQKVVDQPDLRLWDTKDREELSRWIVDTLAYSSELAGGEAAEVQEYLDTLREQFFPMVKMPFLAAQFSVPSVKAIKTILYNKEIGYKQDGGKTFVKRFYRLPYLVFPLQSLALEIAQDSAALEHILQNPDSVQALLEREGLKPDVQDALLKILEQYRRYAETLPKPEDQQSQVSILDQILRDQAGAGKDGADKAVAASKAAAAADVAEDSAPAKPTVQYGSSAWAAMMGKFNFKMPKTELEKDKLAFYEQGSLYTLKELKSEEEAEDFADDLAQSQVLVQAKLQKEFDHKEAARRRAEWAKRRVWGAEEFLAPALPAQDEKQV